jgi:excisionase family DNA binding protein
MPWLKVDAARAHVGGLSRRVLYDAVRRGELRAARVGRGRNFVFSAEWLDDWLRARAEAMVPREERPARLARSA